MNATPRQHTPEDAHASQPDLTRLAVRTLKLTNFRNYASARLDLDARPVVLTGDNGSGKTNLLEAVSLLGPGHGLRGRPYVELARKDGDGGFAIAATVMTRAGETEIGTGLLASARDEGTGLGLAIVRQIISEHDGFVRAEPNLPCGTRIIIEIPLKLNTESYEDESTRTHSR